MWTSTTAPETIAGKRGRRSSQNGWSNFLKCLFIYSFIIVTLPKSPLVDFKCNYAKEIRQQYISEIEQLKGELEQLREFQEQHEEIQRLKQQYDEWTGKEQAYVKEVHLRYSSSKWLNSLFRSKSFTILWVDSARRLKPPTLSKSNWKSCETKRNV